MRVLITGGAGFIGSKLASKLCEAGHTITVLDNLTTGFRNNVPTQSEFIPCDLSQPHFTKALPNTAFDAVCHLAAQSSGEISAEDPLYDFRTNALATVELTRWCIKNHIPRFLYASSMAIYGDVTDLPVREISRCHPLSYYGASKLTSESYLQLAMKEGLQATALRMFSVYGPGQNLNNLKQGMVSIYLAYMLRGEQVPVKGSLDRFRDFVYIDDVVDAWTRALTLSQTQNFAYNVGSGTKTTVHELLTLLKQALQLPNTYPILEGKGSFTDQFGLFADIHAIKKDLGWTPKMTLWDGIQKMALWARSFANDKNA